MQLWVSTAALGFHCFRKSMQQHLDFATFVNSSAKILKRRDHPFGHKLKKIYRSYNLLFEMIRLIKETLFSSIIKSI